MPEAFQNQPSKENSLNFEGKISLQHLNLGSMLAKGCNAAVFTAFWKPGVFYEEINGNSETLSDGSFGPLAVKMMFNFTAESNALAIGRAMYRESVPAQMGTFLEHTGSVNRFRLPVHVNIVEMLCAFADFIPTILEGPQDFPDALPARLHETGLGRNMTYFLVMRRYDCTLREYLRTQNPSCHTSLLLFSQLLEGLLHLHNHRVAHRDLKSDNILLSVTEGTECPHLVITDFGCCLAERSFEVAYPNEDVFRGGNTALMAPEVITAVPGRCSVIDFQKADIWAAGTIAYEIFGAKNPFYEGTPFHLENHSYQDKDLAPLPPQASTPLQKVIKAMLARDPQKRLSAPEVADLCQLLVHAPVGLPLRQQEVLLWLVALAGLTFYHQGEPGDAVEQQLRTQFLSRISLQSTLKALHFLDL